MHVDHIFASLRRHMTFSILMVSQVALCCAILSNAIFFVSQRVERLNMVSGLTEDEVIRIRPVDTQEVENPDVIGEEDLAAIRSIPGVKFAAQTSMMPMSESDDAIPIRLDPQEKAPRMQATAYFGDRHLLDAMGLTLVRGRRFSAEDEVVWRYDKSEMPALPQAIVTHGLAEQLFPGENPLGKTFYTETSVPVRIVGVVANLKRGYVLGKEEGFDNSVIFPVRASYKTFYGNYVIRTNPERRQAVLDAAVAKLTEIQRKRVMFSKDTFEDIRANYFRKDSALTWALASICIALLLVTAFGIVGISSFWVQKRTRQIGIRRALGSTRHQILGHFLFENVMLVGAGSAIGVCLAYVVNQIFMGKYELERLPIAYALLGAAILIIVGQLSVLQPALRASSISAADAIREA